MEEGHIVADAISNIFAPDERPCLFPLSPQEVKRLLAQSKRLDELKPEHKSQ